MVELASLWLPIVVSAVVVFFASFLMWMVLPHHRSDWKRLPDEDGLVAAMAKQGVARGQYSFPYCATPAAMKDPAWIQKMEDEPAGFMIIRPTGPMTMGKSMLLSVVHNLVISFVIAYLASRTLTTASDYGDVFRLVGVGALLGYGGAWPVHATWFDHSWSSTWKHIFDAAIYALLTAGVFAAMW